MSKSLLISVIKEHKNHKKVSATNKMAFELPFKTIMSHLSSSKHGVYAHQKSP